MIAFLRAPIIRTRVFWVYRLFRETPIFPTRTVTWEMLTETHKQLKMKPFGVMGGRCFVNYHVITEA